MDLQDHVVTSIAELSALVYSRKSLPEAQGRIGEHVSLKETGRHLSSLFFDGTGGMM
jgi:hypothetical protein